ncbi:restriction endonuclease subunit S [Vibrio parahaemolyticus]
MEHKVNKAAVRFNEFSDLPKVFNLVDLSVTGISNGVFNDTKKVGSGYRLINVKDMYDTNYVDTKKLTLLNIEDKEFNKNKVQYGDIFFTRSSIVPSGIAYSNVCLSKAEDITFDGHLMKLSPDLSFVEPSYLAYKLRTWTMRTRLIRRGKQSTMTTIGQSDIADIPVELPTIEEQQKIASFLSKVDEKIALLTEKKDKLTEYKKGVMQQLFNGKWEEQDGQLIFIPPTLRFKADDDSEFPDWEEIELGKLSKKSTVKNKDNSVSVVLTNSATQGIISQADYFDRDIANQSNLDGYYVVNPDDFVYNPRISIPAPVGPINRNKIDVGVMSPLYTVFSVKKGLNLSYLEYFFKTTNWHRYMNSIANFGARHDRMNITTSDFFKMPIPVPCIAEQNKIVHFVSSIDQKIDLANSELDKTKEWKKGLLQQMFV